MIDLHLHSSYSDGLDTPKKLIDKAIALDLKAIALTDHDSIDGVEEFIGYGEKKEIITISGIEFSIKHEPKREIKDVHIVGLNIDYTSSELKRILALQRKGRIQQKKDIIARLREEFSYDITFNEVKSVAKSKTIGRPHIVEVLLKNNADKLKHMSKNDIFKMISLGGKAYVDRKYEVTLEQAIDLIKKVEGIAILAHPGIYDVSDKEKFVKMCIKAGINGIEIEYTYKRNRPYYGTDKADWAQIFFPKFYANLANKYNLIKSGGSDYHGGKKGINLGEAQVPDEYLVHII